MVFQRKFFLDLSGGEAEPTPTVVAPVRQARPETPAEGKEKAPAASLPAPASPAAAQAEPAATPSAPSLTTAEAIIAELAAAQANRPAPSQVTFAPDCVTAGGAVPQRRRRAGANLAGFKSMAQAMMKS